MSNHRLKSERLYKEEKLCVSFGDYAGARNLIKERTALHAKMYRRKHKVTWYIKRVQWNVYGDIRKIILKKKK